ncbi:MAG: Dabb family protein [Deltaproteobacteria bacterium]|nr:Dabb family protein [Deltaproteobacteria bacterium]
MIQHIVFFKFKDNVTEADKERLTTELRSLKDNIALVKELTVGVDVAHQKKSYDLALNSTFETMEDLMAYAVDEYHLEVLKLVVELCASTCKVDYEI